MSNLTKPLTLLPTVAATTGVILGLVPRIQPTTPPGLNGILFVTIRTRAGLDHRHKAEDDRESRLPTVRFLAAAACLLPAAYLYCR